MTFGIVVEGSADAAVYEILIRRIRPEVGSFYPGPVVASLAFADSSSAT
jgi:hypothetical protein